MTRDELVEKMYATMRDIMNDSGFKQSKDKLAHAAMMKALSAALSAAIEEARTCVAKTLSQPPDAFFAPATTRYVEMVDNEIRANLERVKSIEERVTIVKWVHDPTRWIALVDEWNMGNTGGFKDKKDAEIYRLGLIQKLKESNGN